MPGTYYLPLYNSGYDKKNISEQFKRSIAALALRAHKCNILYTYTAYIILYIINIRFAARKSRDSQRCSLTGAVANTGPVVGAHLAKNIGTHITLCLYYFYTYIGIYVYIYILTPRVCITPRRRHDHRVFTLRRYR